MNCEFNVESFCFKNSYHAIALGHICEVSTNSLILIYCICTLLKSITRNCKQKLLRLSLDYNNCFLLFRICYS